jgi:hypothetical protein
MAPSIFYPNIIVPKDIAIPLCGDRYSEHTLNVDATRSFRWYIHSINAIWKRDDCLYFDIIIPPQLCYEPSHVMVDRFPFRPPFDTTDKKKLEDAVAVFAKPATPLSFIGNAYRTDLCCLYYLSIVHIYYPYMDILVLDCTPTWPFSHETFKIIRLPIMNDWVVFDEKALSRRLWLQFLYHRLLEYWLGSNAHAIPRIQAPIDKSVPKKKVSDGNESFLQV